ncbi:DUF948 domain-containing protein [Geomonas sp. Red69]|uniref:DUF948 domain-containing protein n=1 Tax=Geomonas diazotrophica TaxID=2843197 RepID=A0ABX8JN61_9BACT|nr:MULTISPECIES: DUF948 domain-containing protein [Geomonas]MBU5635726.1 DUF948 domain-containing protein [Geomonas diazotrophica]QWV98037.1 DUF948 domain-containing protein [Geomonas nitrogeniifigens]QXE87168.1 DUF948 domain-containing protein [Geomonas nitrogeniifigens]
MLFLQITSAVTALTLVVLALCLIPVLTELKKAAIALQGAADLLQKEVTPLVKELRDTVADVQVVTGAAAANADGVNMLLSELGHAGHNIRMINKVLGIASDIVTNSSVWMAGAKVAGRYIADRIIKTKIRG